MFSGKDCMPQRRSFKSTAPFQFDELVRNSTSEDGKDADYIHKQHRRIWGIDSVGTPETLEIYLYQ